MTAQELTELVFETINKHSECLEKKDYLAVLESVIADAQIRAEAVTQELYES